MVAARTFPTDVETDRAITDYRAFLPVGTVHASRTVNCNALDIMLEVVNNLQRDLTAQRKKVLQQA